jgi:hypothetical protein
MSSPAHLDERPLRFRLAALRFFEEDADRRLVDDALFRFVDEALFRLLVAPLFLVLPRLEEAFRFVEATFRFEDDPDVRFDADFRFEDDALFRFVEATFRFEDDPLFRFVAEPLFDAVLRFVELPLRDAVFRDAVFRDAVFRVDPERVVDLERDFEPEVFDLELDVFDERLEALFLRELVDLREPVDLRELDVFRRVPPRPLVLDLPPCDAPPDSPSPPSSDESSSSSEPISFRATPTAAGIATPSAVPATTFCVVESPSSSSFDMVTSRTPPLSGALSTWRR